MAVAGMVLGICAIFFCWIPFLNWTLALLGIVFGALGIARGNKVGRGKGMAITGLVTGALGGILGVVLFLMLMRGVEHFVKTVKNIGGEVIASRIDKDAKSVAIEKGSFPTGSAPLTPAGPCCGQPNNMCKVSPTDWENPVWKALDFDMFETETSYQVSYESADGKTFTAKVVSDADCDGTPAVWEIHGSVDASGVPVINMTVPPPDTF
jgi:hypothetical protein